MVEDGSLASLQALFLGLAHGSESSAQNFPCSLPFKQKMGVFLNWALGNWEFRLKPNWAMKEVWRGFYGDVCLLLLCWRCEYILCEVWIEKWGTNINSWNKDNEIVGFSILCESCATFEELT